MNISKKQINTKNKENAISQMIGKYSAKTSINSVDLKHALKEVVNE